jgi:hypothetical protein
VSADQDAACEQVLGMAARDESLPDDAFILISRALAGLDPITGEPRPKVLPKRMHMRRWFKSVASLVEVGQADGWYWRCPRKSCDAWGGPFRTEQGAVDDGRETHFATDRPRNGCR